MDRITVVIPIYNAEEYLHKCVDSALSQTLREIQILLVDDGSTDTSATMCDQYAAKDSRVLVIHKSNGGVCDARNVGIAAVKTEYFTFLESDDWLPDDACEKMLRWADETDVDFVMGAYNRVSTSGTSIKHPLTEKKVLFNDRDEITTLMGYILGLTGSRLQHPDLIDSFLTDTAKLFKTSIVKENNLLWVSRKTVYSDCLDFLLKYANCCKRAVYRDEPIYFYRRTNTSSQTAAYRPATVDLWFNQFECLQQFIKDNHLEPLKQAFYARVCFTVIPIGGNACRSADHKTGMADLKRAFNHPIYKEAFAYFEIAALPIHYQPLFFFAKNKMYHLFYSMTILMRKIMNRQRGL